MEEHACQSFIIPTQGVRLKGDLTVPNKARGVVLFAHGSGSSRLSNRNRSVARMLNEHGLATLLMDLLTTEEDGVDRLTQQYRFDIPMLARRLVGAVDWLAENHSTRGLPIGLFGASTGAAAALIAAAVRARQVAAVVSRGGRVDLAGNALPKVLVPTLLIVGAHDQEVLALNHDARDRMKAPTDLRVISGAGHLFEEPGTLAQVAQLACHWFEKHLSMRRVKDHDARNPC